MSSALPHLEAQVDAAMAAEQASAAAPPRRRLKLVLKTVILAVFVFFWVVSIRKSLPDLKQMEWTIAPRAVAGACGVFALGAVLFGVLWAPLCYEITGIRLGVARAFRASMIAWAVRYLPGKVWSVAGKAYLSCSDRAEAVPVTIAITVETIWFELSGLLLAAIMLPWAPGLRLMQRGSGAASGIFIAACFLLTWPPIFCRIANLALKVLRQPPLPRRPRYHVLLLLTLGYMAVFALFSASFIVLARALVPVPVATWPLIVGTFTSSWVFGVLVFLAPGGLGARETSLMGLLGKAGVFPIPVIAKLVVFSRLVTTGVEILCALVALALPLAGVGLGERDGKR